MGWLSSHAWGTAALLFGFSAILRWLVSLRILAIFNDGPRFLRVAQLMEEGRWLDALSHPYHPLYPLTVRLAKLGTSDWETAAVGASIVGGSLAVVALYFFLREAFDPTLAWVGGALMAAHPYVLVFSADVQSEGVYLACFLGAIAFLWRALCGAGERYAFAAGAAAGLSYLTRPEGLGVTLVGAGFGLGLLLLGKWSAAKSARFVLALATGTALLAAPYVMVLHSLSGEWSLSRKKSLANLAVTESYVPPALDEMTEPTPPAHLPSELEAAPPRIRSVVQLEPIPESLEPVRDREPAALIDGRASGRLTGAALDLVRNAVSSLRIELALLTVIGLVAYRGKPGRRGLLIGSLLLLYGIVLFGLTLNVGYLSRRHVLPPLLPLLGYAAVGLGIVGGALVSGAARVLGRRPSLHRAWGTAVGLSIVLLVGLPKGLSPHRVERVAERRAAEWLRGQEPRVGAVAAEAPRAAYYAGRPLVPLVRGSEVSSYQALVTSGARFAIVDEAKFDDYTGFREALGTGLYLIHREEALGRRTLVLELATSSGDP